MTVGCNAIIISGLCHKEYTSSKNDMNVISYPATAIQGAKALVKSYQDKCLVRVFRSSLCEPKPKDDDTATYKGTLYKYYGLYMISSMENIKKNEHELFVFILEKAARCSGPHFGSN
jgi:SAD/SRA domain